MSDPFFLLRQWLANVASRVEFGVIAGAARDYQRASADSFIRRSKEFGSLEIELWAIGIGFAQKPSTFGTVAG